MKRLYIAALLALITAATVLSGMYVIHSSCDKTAAALQRSAAAVQDGSAQARLFAEAAEREWRAAEGALRWFVNSGTLNEIGLSVAALPPLADGQDTAAFLSELRRVQQQLAQLANDEAVE